MSGWARRILAVLTASARRWWGIFALLVVLVAAANLARDIPNYPANRAAEYRTTPALATAIATFDAKDRLALEKDLLQYETDNQIKIWTGIVQAIGAVVLAVGGYFTYRNLRVAQEGQITNRFTQAIAQLGAELKDGKPNLEVRLGGIYALERIARDSPRDHWTIVEVLTAYVRENSPWPPRSSPSKEVSFPTTFRVAQGASEWLQDRLKRSAFVGREQKARDETQAQVPPLLRTDIQAILTVLGRRTRSDDRQEPARLNLRATDLRRANLAHAHLERADLVRAHMEKADLWDTYLEQADLGYAHLTGALLSSAHLDGASLGEAHLEHAYLGNASLEQAFLGGAHVKSADFAGAHLKQAYLDRTDLSTAKNLTEEQLKSAASRKGARLPECLARLEEPDEPVTESAPPPP